MRIPHNTLRRDDIRDEQGRAYFRLGPHCVYEMIGGMWKKVREEPVYYCHDPRPVYSGPPSSSHRPWPVNRWVITGRLGQQPFTTSGHTADTFRGARALLPAGMTAGAIVLGRASFAALVATTTIVVRRRNRSR